MTGHLTACSPVNGAWFKPTKIHISPHRTQFLMIMPSAPSAVWQSANRSAFAELCEISGCFILRICLAYSADPLCCGIAEAQVEQPRSPPRQFHLSLLSCSLFCDPICLYGRRVNHGYQGRFHGPGHSGCSAVLFSRRPSI